MQIPIMAGIEDEVNHHDQWCYYATRLKEVVGPLRKVLDIIERPGADLSEAQQILSYEVKFYNSALTTLTEKGFQTISHEIYAMYRDLLRGRMVIFNDIDMICDTVGQTYSEFIEGIRVVGEADVLWVDGDPRLVNKRWNTPLPNTMFYDHFPCYEEETLAALEDGQTKCEIEGWAIRLDEAIIPKQRF